MIIATTQSIAGHPVVSTPGQSFGVVVRSEIVAHGVAVVIEPTGG